MKPQRVASSRRKVGKGPRAVKLEVVAGAWLSGSGPPEPTLQVPTILTPCGATSRPGAICHPSPASLSCAAVPRLDPCLIEVYVFRRRRRRAEFLVLRRRTGDSLPGVWQPVTGSLRRGERAVQGALREVREEAGAVPLKLWRLETVTAFFDPRRDAIRFVALFAAEVADRVAVRLSREHSAHRFVSAREAAKCFLWDSQRDGLAAVRRQVLRGGARARALGIALPGRRD